MRLINVVTMEMVFFTINLNSLPHEHPYAILSHTWGEGEVSFQDYHGPKRQSMKGFAKIKACCMQARKDGIAWVWIDTCCIDKKDSAELSEAINSMYAWYRESAVCYTILDDVPPRSPRFPHVEFRKARWFTRGWCLQELLAPRRVEFYASDWSELGTKWSLSTTIREITGIPHDALCHNRPLSHFPAGERMSWASNRKTSRTEDVAYCLLGIFDVNMPLMYGEGKKSFTRLQMEILREKEDYSLFLHKTDLLCTYGHKGWSALASDPDLFHQLSFNTSSYESYDYRALYALSSSHLRLPTKIAQEMMARNAPYMTSQGLRISLLTLRAEQYPRLRSGSILVWTEFMLNKQLVCVELMQARSEPFTIYMRASVDAVHLVEIENLPSLCLESLQLAAGQHDIDPGSSHPMLNTRRFKALEVVLSSASNSTLRLMESSLPRGMSGGTFDDSVNRLSFRDFQSQNIPVSRNRTSSAFQLLLRVYHGAISNGVFLDLAVTVFLHPEYPRCLIKYYPHGREQFSSHEPQVAWTTPEFYDHASDFAALELPGWPPVTGLVKVRRRSVTSFNSPSQQYLVILSITVRNDEILTQY